MDIVRSPLTLERSFDPDAEESPPSSATGEIVISPDLLPDLDETEDLAADDLAHGDLSAAVPEAPPPDAPQDLPGAAAEDVPGGAVEDVPAGSGFTPGSDREDRIPGGADETRPS